MRVTLDNTSPLLQYVSVDEDKTWIQDSAADSKDGQISKYFRQTMAKTTGVGNYMSLDFNGTEIWVYGAKRWNHGVYSVSIGGNEPIRQSGNVTEPGSFQALLYHGSNLDPDRMHHIKVSNTAETNVTTFLDIDHVVIEVDKQDEEIFTTRIDDTASNCQYTGDGWWTGPPMRPEMYFNTTAHISGSKGDKVVCSFNGTSIEVLGGLFSDHGNYSVSIDGGPPITLNGSYPTFQAQTTLFLATNLDDGPHNISMINTDLMLDLDYTIVNSTIDPSAPLNLTGTTIIEPVDAPGLLPGDPTKPKQGDEDNGVLIGGVIGAVAGITLLSLLSFILWRKWRKSRRPTTLAEVEKYGYRSNPHSRSHPLSHARSQSSQPFQVDLVGEEISPFTTGMYTYQDSPGDNKRSPQITGPPLSAFAIHPYQSGIPKSPASSTRTTDLILGLGPVPARKRPEMKPRHERQASILDTIYGRPSPLMSTARSEEDRLGYNQQRTAGTGPGSAGTGSSGWSPRPKGAQFSLPALALPPKMFVLGQDGEVEPLGSPGRSTIARSSIATRR